MAAPKQIPAAAWSRMRPVSLHPGSANGIGGLEVYDLHIVPSRKVPKPIADAKAIAAWYVLRVRTWPPNAATPSEAEDLAAARAAHDGRISRDLIREIRKEKAPKEWLKTGPKPRS
jgi:hypothetical protein